MDKVRTRFAPSPTGPLHMGNVRTALFNYLFARNQKGDFVLRIEDTDKERSEKQWEDDLLENLKWLGLNWNEGVEKGGPYESYRQSERTDLYEKYLKKLLDEKKAYYCFCTEEELEAQRQEQMSRGEAPRYRGTCRQLTIDQQQKQLKAGTPSVIRFIMEVKPLAFEDLVRGKVQFDTGLIGDTVVAKDLKTPLYNFSVVIDDFEMKITHVIRGEDHIANTPKQILLQEALSFPRPVYIHLPLILAEDRTKLSKRHGDNSVTRFRKEGYLPEAVVNFLALLGWNPGDEREIFSLEELVKEFSVEKIQKAGAVFNVKRLDWINGAYIRKKTPKELAELSKPYLPEGVKTEDVEKVIVLYQARLKKMSEITELADFFFAKELKYDKKMLIWKGAGEQKTREALEQVQKILLEVKEKDWNKEKLQEILMPEAEKVGDRGLLLWPLRVALTGKEASAGPFEVAQALGKTKTLQRIEEARTLIQ
ncbi:MAG: glutamate--tRNA ligase [Candidatus Wildermuthbacteria bacterium RIFCSPHIGHO2_01_FULL_48_25]|uniref:Glutamate--tRNA ligase n=1 Tax=Candidatus Wildermuthbacteria bacterium RIFCSPLOWO2_01_FULL_48_16 TaxID=1802461 RepID=A0A1G2RJF5_9BACT|nr:MAG: glutamate--tRNA ligase [Candidatus Wildermuthbacteria bacterium RIFCSPHIGHO2_01_FULL_48_25]OHA69184.1 MAG: glutamate--tRNA ligase [Candidatus Wildermuthbacteria bacterium RIFCSPHIGHO2_02_FULL_49_12b]OHA72917.1 MAG: glutamate--tRNA ligase [Candidatus Wildermuthbacteria bacterium RIFCSPLOWO2_01_FULL_48_16]